MKFKYVGNKIFDEDGKEMPINSYGGKTVYYGDVIELDAFFSEKAEKNDSYEKIKPGPKTKQSKSMYIEDATGSFK